MARRNLFSDFIRMRIGNPPSARRDLPIVNKNEEIVNEILNNSIDQEGKFYSTSQLNQFRTIAQDRQSQYDIYDEMATDSTIAAALEIYADDATQMDEQGRIIWVESDDEEITKAGNRLLDILEIPERAWKHIYMACKYGDYYLKFYREESDDDTSNNKSSGYNLTARIINDKVEGKGVPPYSEYLEDVPDPATVFDLRKRGKTAGFVEVTKDEISNHYQALTNNYSLKDVNLYRPDRLVHIMISDNLSRNPETVTLDFGEESQATYEVARGKSILFDVYPIQKELQLLEDALLLNRLTRSSLIRLLEIEVGDMPKKEVNDYLRRIKNLIEQHTALNKETGDYKSYNSPGPVDNVIYIPTKNGRGSISVNNLGGDVNVRDIADIDYFSNKRAGALKIPRSYLGDDKEGSGFDNGGTLTKLSARYARTIMRIQTAYIRAITTVLNLFFIDKKLDYVNKFKVRMTSPSTQEDIDRTEILSNNIDLISSIMSLMESLEGDTQKKILDKLISDTLKMPEIAALIREDMTPSEDIAVDGEMTRGDFDGPDIDLGGPSSETDISSELSDFGGGSEGSPEEGGFTDDEYAEFEDEI